MTSLRGSSVGRRVGIAWALLFGALPLMARPVTVVPSTEAVVVPWDELPALVVPEIDALAELAVEEALSDSPRRALRIARPADLTADWSENGRVETLPGDRLLWRTMVVAPGATDLSLGFDRFELPPGAKLWVHAPEHEWVLGPWDQHDVDEHGQLWTPVLPGDLAVLELELPAAPAFPPQLRLARVARGFRDLFGVFGPRARSLPCNIDPVCPEGAGWEDQVRSVAAYTVGGVRVCTGTLITDIGPRMEPTMRPWFLTAGHCEVDDVGAPTLVVYWNFENSTCMPGTPDGDRSQSQNGSRLVAWHGSADFALLELDDDPDPSFDVYFAGWDLRGFTPTQSATIHHPAGDEKALAFENDLAGTGDSCIAPESNTHWIVNWDAGTTEIGSSGSPLFDERSRFLLGMLSGGNSTCFVSGPDCYGRLDVARDIGVSPHGRLEDWIAPEGGIATVGRDPEPRIFLDDVRIRDRCPTGGPSGDGIADPGEDLTVEIDLRSAYGNFSGAGAMIFVPEPHDEYVEIVTGGMAWGALRPGIPVTSIPHLELRVSPDAPCPMVVNLQLDIFTDSGEFFPLQLPIELGRNGLPEPKHLGEIGTIVVEYDSFAEGTVNDLSVFLQLTHQRVGDLRITLESPAGTPVVLLDRPGVPATVEGCTDDDFTLRFLDSASLDLEPHCPGTAPWAVGPARPMQPLSVFNDENRAGTWTLTIEDNLEIGWGDLVQLRLSDAEGNFATQRCQVCDSVVEPCVGVEHAPTGELRLTKGVGDEVVLSFPDAATDCAAGVAVFAAPTPRPAVGIGSFPMDPVFTNVTSEDTDPGADFRHVPPADPLTCYLVVEDLGVDGFGPAGHYE